MPTLRLLFFSVGLVACTDEEERSQRDQTKESHLELHEVRKDGSQATRWGQRRSEVPVQLPVQPGGSVENPPPNKPRDQMNAATAPVTPAASNTVA